LPREKIVIFADGACEPKNPGGVPTYGFVIYREEKLAEESGLAAKPWSEEASNNVAEYVAFIKALEKLRLLHLEDSEIEVRADSRLLIEQIKGIFSVKAPRLIPLHNKVRELLTHFKKIQFKWIPREGNTEADSLTKAAYSAHYKTLEEYTHRM
jgi:ribonuclease HI